MAFDEGTFGVFGYITKVGACATYEYTQAEDFLFLIPCPTLCLIKLAPVYPPLPLRLCRVWT